MKQNVRVPRIPLSPKDMLAGGSVWPRDDTESIPRDYPRKPAADSKLFSRCEGLQRAFASVSANAPESEHTEEFLPPRNTLGRIGPRSPTRPS